MALKLSTTLASSNVVDEIGTRRSLRFGHMDGFLEMFQLSHEGDGHNDLQRPRCPLIRIDQSRRTGIRKQRDLLAADRADSQCDRPEEKTGHATISDISGTPLAPDPGIFNDFGEFSRFRAANSREATL